MNWDFSIKLTDLAIILATFCGPIFAVRTQRKLDDAKALRAGRERVFNMLMSTRATWLAPGRIEALNSIPIAFYGKGEDLKAVNDAWRELFHLFDHATAPEWKNQENAWEAKRRELDTALLGKIGHYLGYEFPPLDVRTQHYFPVHLGDRISDEESIRRGLARLLTGKAVLPVAPLFPDKVAEEQKALRDSLEKLLAGEKALHVQLDQAQK
ncbi:hypothetical protein DF153_18100 [Burkholderia cenocepacia]|nr:hypothetical protein DF152_19565 [Burkholderia cenocepacia]RQU23396.1 hypothetical protein DF153_18100 [Burkholderia cenocepacia]